MKEKRRDNKGRILHTGESQRTDGKYLYKYVDAFGNTKYVYAWRLTPTDPTPKGKREKPSLRELEQQIRRDIEDGIDSTGKKMTLCQLYAKQNAQRANVKKSTQKQREQLMRLLKEDKLGARSIDTIKPSDAKEWALRMKEKGFSYNTINNHKRSLKASFYIAIQDDCVRKNPFDFKLSEVLENDTKEKVALTEEQEQALLSFIRTDNVYDKYYDDVLILLKTGLRISELCGLTVADIDFKNEVVIIDHQLLKSKKSTQKQREQLMRLLKEDKLGARSIDTIKPSDAKEWALRMKDKGFSYNTINNHKRSLKASFYIAIPVSYTHLTLPTN